MPMYKILSLALLVYGVAFPAYANEGELPPPHRPGFYEHALERAKGTAEILENRARGIFKEGFLEQHEGIQGRIREHASTTEGDVLLHREEWKQRWNEHHEKFGSTTDRWKAQFSGEMKGRIADRADHAATLLSAVLERLTGIFDRIQSRIDQVSSEGADVKEAQNALDEASGAIAAAQDAIQNLINALKDALASENPQEAMTSLHALRETAKQTLRTAHEALRTAAHALQKPSEHPSEESVSE